MRYGALVWADSDGMGWQKKKTHNVERMNERWYHLSGPNHALMCTGQDLN